MLELEHIAQLMPRRDHLEVVGDPLDPARLLLFDVPENQVERLQVLCFA
jgi:hypothetical protein